MILLSFLFLLICSVSLAYSGRRMFYLVGRNIALWHRYSLGEKYFISVCTSISFVAGVVLWVMSFYLVIVAGEVLSELVTDHRIFGIWKI